MPTGETVQIDGDDLAIRPFVPSRELVCLDSNVGGGQALRSSLERFHRGPLAFDEGSNCASLGRPSADDPTLRAAPRVVALGHDHDGTTASLRAAGPYSFAAVDGGRREGLFFEVDYTTERRVGDQSFLDPEALSVYEHEDDPIVLPGHAVVLVHHDTLDNNTAHVLVSRLGLDDGTLAWTITLPAGEVKMGTRHDDLVIVAIDLYADKASLVLGIDWETGAEVWRYKI
jgi:hypothetical protein